MSAPADQKQPEFTPKLQDIEVELIDRNQENPRMLFPEDELSLLAESIEREGVLVPVVVYASNGRYTLIDGERRFRCAKTLGLDTIPAVITAPRSSRENLVQMFNIHLVRAAWQDMPTAWALQRLVQQLEADGVDVTDAALRDITGLSRERIQRYRHALTLSDEFQNYIYEGTIPLNWFWELKKNVIEPMAARRPQLWTELGGESAITRSFVQKRLDGTISDTVSLRDVRPIINYAAEDSTAQQKESVLDNTLRSLVSDPDVTIEAAYEDSVQIMVEADKLEGRTSNMLKSFARLLGLARSDEDRQYIVSIGENFVTSLTALLSSDS